MSCRGVAPEKFLKEAFEILNRDYATLLPKIPAVLLQQIWDKIGGDPRITVPMDARFPEESEIAELVPTRNQKGWRRQVSVLTKAETLVGTNDAWLLPGG